MDWDLATDIILYASFATLGVFVVLACYQLVTRKSLKAVDLKLKLMPVPLALMAAIYLVFDKFLILNTRPNGSGEASFPSTHVLVVATIFGLAVLALPRYLKNKPLRYFLSALMLILTILTCIGRVAANMHWLSDVIGGLVFAIILVTIYYLLTKEPKNA